MQIDEHGRVLIRNKNKIDFQGHIFEFSGPPFVILWYNQ